MLDADSFNAYYIKTKEKVKGDTNMGKMPYISNEELTQRLVDQGFDFSPDPFADEEPDEVIDLTREDVMEYLGLKIPDEPEEK